VSVTVTVAVPDLLVSTVEVALTVKVVAVSPAATVRVPLVILVPAMPPVTDHVTVCAAPPVTVTVAVNSRVVPFCTLTVAGLTVTLVTVGEPPPLVTVTVAVPDLLVSTVEVALTVKVVAVSPAATVRFPSVILVPVMPPVTVHVTVCAGLLVPVTVAENACVPPFCTLAVEGLTVTLVTVGEPPPPPVTVTAAVPDLLVSTVEVALTVSDVRVSSEATVSFPVASIVVPAFLPVSTIDHVTVCAGLLVPVTVAVNTCVPPLATLAVAGLTVTLVTVGAIVYAASNTALGVKPSLTAIALMVTGGVMAKGLVYLVLPAPSFAGAVVPSVVYQISAPEVLVLRVTFVPLFTAPAMGLGSAYGLATVPGATMVYEAVSISLLVMPVLIAIALMVVVVVMVIGLVYLVLLAVGLVPSVV